MHAVAGDDQTTNGVSGQVWGGNRARSALIAKFFPNVDEAPNVESYVMPFVAQDDRAIFDGVGRTVLAEDPATFKSGFAVAKFINVKSDGSNGHDATFPDADFFFFRTAEAYLTYAEATARLNGGSATADGVAAINAVRSRANAVTRSGYSLNDILDEWSREFYFEGRRRVDLIRFGKFGGNSDYKWEWKGGTLIGRNFDSYRNIFAIPASQLSTYGNVQNPGY
jgi:hypothetical protein